MSSKSCSKKLTFFINSNEIVTQKTYGYDETNILNGTLTVTKSMILYSTKNNKPIGNLKIYSIFIPSLTANLSNVESKFIFTINKYQNNEMQTTTFSSDINLEISNTVTDIETIANLLVKGLLQIDSNPKLAHARGKFRLYVPAVIPEGSYKIGGDIIIKH